MFAIRTVAPWIAGMIAGIIVLIAAFLAMPAGIGAVHFAGTVTAQSSDGSTGSPDENNWG